MIKLAANPVELAVAAAFLGGQVGAKDVEAFAQKTAAALEAGGVDPGQWRAAVARWTGAEQTITWRSQAADLVKQNRRVLQNLAEEIDHIARIPAVAAQNPSRAVIDDWVFQLGLGSNGRRVPSEIAADPAFLERGRFAAYPDRIVPPAQMEVGSKGPLRTEIPVDLGLLKDPMGAELSAAMDKQWGFLHERGVEGFINPNTLTRYTYNQFAVRRILSNLEGNNTRDARVLLVTGYETPIHELLESGRVKEVVVADLSANAAKMLAQKYAHHPNAKKLKIEVKDFSGLDLGAQQRALDTLAEAKPGAPLSAAVAEAYFTEISKPESLKPVAYESRSFDAVHLPFVAGAFHLGAATVAASRGASGNVDLESYFGAGNLANKDAQQALARTDKHVLDEARRITKRGGLVVTEVWARPTDKAEAPIRFSDTPVTKGAFDRIVSGYEHWFSGNPQPGLPHTVGHVLATIC